MYLFYRIPNKGLPVKFVQSSCKGPFKEPYSCMEETSNAFSQLNTVKRSSPT